VVLEQGKIFVVVARADILCGTGTGKNICSSSECRYFVWYWNREKYL
jgi:hypothetical protein